MADAFDAADAAACPVAALAALAPEDWPQVRFAFHASATVLTLAKGICCPAFEAAAAETACRSRTRRKTNSCSSGATRTCKSFIGR